MNPTPGPAYRPGPHNKTGPRPISRLLGVLCLIVFLPAAAQLSALPEADAMRQAAAVARARTGDYRSALDELARLRQSYPDAVPLLYDEIVVLAWAEQDNLVADRAATIDRNVAPLHVRLAIAKSLRNLRRFDQAQAWYAAAVAMAGDDIEARLGLAYASADAGQGDAAEQALGPLSEQPEASLRVALARAYIHERAGRWLQAVASYDRVLEIEPGRRDALRGKALALRSLLLPRQALELAAAHPGILTDAELGRLQADVIALQLRYGAQAAYPTAQRNAMTDRAIASLDAYLASGVADPLTELALRSDRIIALAERGDSADAIAAFEALDAEGADLAAPVLAAAGKSYMREHRPESARAVLERAVALQPGSLDLEIALFYAYTDGQDYDTALALARELAAAQPLLIGPQGGTGQPNPDRLRAELLIGVALSYQDRLDEAQAHLERWLAGAPNNTDLRHELANIYRWRGWPDRSVFEYQQVLTVDPELMEARIGRAYTELDRSEYEIVASDVDMLNREYPGEASVERLTAAWIARTSSELTVDATTHDSSGVTFGSRQYRYALNWRSAPIDFRYRILAGTSESYAAFPEGDGRRSRLSAGLQYEYGRWLASAELTGNRGGGALGATVAVDYRLSDVWTLSSGVELDSDAVPLRGHRVGIDSDLLRIGARYAPDERLTITTSLVAETLSDGNGRKQLSMQGRGRVFNRSRIAVDVIGEAFVGIRERDDVPYFSPLRDVAVIAGAELQWRMLRRYERRMTHVFRAEIGSYDQSGFSRGNVWRVAYMMPFEWSPSFSTWLGLWRNRMFYDGAQEYSTTASLTLQWRF
jgi:biofilm PGA synthesis protein PgaA